MTKKRASDYERMLVNRFWDNGFAVMRAPSSSGTKKMPRPDIFVGSAKKKLMFSIEIKTSRQNVFYVQESQIKGLLEFTKRMGGKAYLAVKFVGKRMDFLFLAVPDSLTKSKGGSYRVDIETLKEKGIDFSSLIRAKVENTGTKTSIQE
ncbi:MAG: Holliday junction resolvase Hjc [Candidatus Heimdallarchaeaceae archaeon]